MCATVISINDLFPPLDKNNLTELHLFLCVVQYCTRTYRSVDTEVVMVVWNDTIECVVSQSYHIFLQNTLTHVLAVGFTVTGLKDRCVVRVQSLHCKGRKSFIPKGVISLDPTVKVIWNYLVPFYLVPLHL